MDWDLSVAQFTVNYTNSEYEKNYFILRTFDMK